MNNDLVIASEGLLKRLEKIGKFNSKYKVLPFREMGMLCEELNNAAESISDIEHPENQDELFQSELKRRLFGEAKCLEQRLNPRHYDFDTIISMYAIPTADIECLRDWLKANKDLTLDASERLYKTKNVASFELDLQFDIPDVRAQAEAVAKTHIHRYHKRLGKLLQDLTKAGEFLRDIDASPTTMARSYFNTLTNKLALGILAIFHTDEHSDLHLQERELITLYGHEGMGHALNHVITKYSDLPYFLTKNTVLVTATMESVAQFYQKVIFEDLKASPETQKDLGIQHKFEEIYQEAKDIGQLEEYQLKLLQYAITVLADKSFKDHKNPETMKKKSDLISEFTLNPRFPLDFVEQHRYDYDSQGNLNPLLVGELRYCANPVQRALKEFAKQGITYEGKGRSTIDMALLTGFWTPIGFVDNARLKAQEK